MDVKLIKRDGFIALTIGLSGITLTAILSQLLPEQFNLSSPMIMYNTAMFAVITWFGLYMLTKSRKSSNGP